MKPVEADVARRLQGDIPLAERPFQKIAEEIGLTEAEVLVIADRLRTRGIIRKFGAIIRHQLAGYTRNTMIYFRQDRDEDLLGRIAADAGVGDFKLLRSIEEFKKISMEYF